MTLVILSDMQINASIHENTNTLYDNIKELYSTAGFETPPHIVFWNLRKSSRFPTKSDLPNVTMISGFSSVVLNQFCQKGVDVLKNYSGYMMFCAIVGGSRYDKLEECIRTYFEPPTASSPDPANATSEPPPSTSSWFSGWW